MVLFEWDPEKAKRNLKKHGSLLMKQSPFSTILCPLPSMTPITLKVSSVS